MNGQISLRDPRYYQVAVLGSLVLYGVFVLDFGVHAAHVSAIVITALSVQWAGSRLAGLHAFEPWSALISALSLTLLLRTDSLLLAAVAAVIAIGSKFLVRIRGKHVFNPANVAIVSLVLFSDRAWISTGQWGNAALGALALACLGFIVLTQAKRAETTVTFLIAYALLIFGRAAWLGDPLAIPLHHMQNGALLIFAFFMISDPKTTPDSAAGRIVYASLVAAVAFAIQFVLYRPNGPILALVMCAPLVPLIDVLLHGRRYQWSAPVSGQSGSPAHSREPIKGVSP